MTQSQQRLTLTLVLIALLCSNVAALAQAKKQGTKTTPPTARQADEGLDLSAPANGATTGGSIAAPAAEIDVSDEFQNAADDVRPIPDLDARSKQVGEQTSGGGAARLDKLEAKVDRLERMIEDQSATLADIHAELVKLNDSRRFALRPDLGGDNPSLQSIGRLVVNNYTGVPYPLTINGQQFVVNPGRGEFNVPYGAVTTQLLGYEAPKTWAPGDWREVNGQPQLAIQIR